MKLAKRPLCGQCDHGNLYDESGDEPVVTRCPCRAPQVDGDALRANGTAATADTNPQAMRDALRIIRDHALAMPEFSSNDTRHAMRIAQIPGPVIGAAFQQAAKNRVIRRDGYVSSTDPGTHAHPVVQWVSLIYRRMSA